MTVYTKAEETAKGQEQKNERYKAGLDVITPYAAGLDLHKEVIVACAPRKRGETSFPIKRFKTYTEDLEELVGWLKERGCSSVAMEATGVFWWPVIECLRASGLEVLLVNAREVRSVKGRPKSDQIDCQWLRRLHACGLLRGSYVPNEETAGLKSVWRHRQNLEEESVRTVQRIQKALQIMNVRLDIVVSNVVGETGMRILDAMLGGERDAEKLAKLRDRRVACSEKEIATALRGNYKEEQMFVLGENLSQYRCVQERIAKAEEYLSTRLDKMEKRADPATIPPSSKSSSQTRMRVPSREQLYELLGVDLTQIDGVGVTTVTSFVVTVGKDMSPWPTAKHFVSWLGLAPTLHESAGQKKFCSSKKVSSSLAQAFRMAATTIGRVDSYLGGYYRRLKARIGAPKAITATARKLAILFYHAVKEGAQVVNFKAARYEEAYRERIIQNLRKKAAQQGFQLIPQESIPANS
jgi:transposase